MNKICVITGGSSGIGRSTAHCMCEREYKVYELSRHGKTNGDIIHIDTDVTDENAVKSAIEHILSKDGKIDVLINNAGFGISGAVEFTTVEDAKRQFDVNFFGTFIMCKNVVPVMRKQHFGRIINIGSVAGIVPIPFQSFYSASKAAIRSFSLSLYNEVKDFGISIICIEPGDIKTGFTSSRVKTVIGDEEYGGKVSRSVSKMEHDEQHGMEADIVGKYIANVAAKKSKKPIKSIGFSYKLICILAKILPSRLMVKIIGKMYAK